MGCAGSKKSVEAATPAPAAEKEEGEPKTLLQSLSAASPKKQASLVPAEEDPDLLLAGAAPEAGFMMAALQYAESKMNDESHTAHDTFSGTSPVQPPLDDAAAVPSSLLALVTSAVAAADSSPAALSRSSDPSASKLPVKWVEIEDSPTGKVPADGLETSTTAPCHGCNHLEKSANSNWACLTYCKHQEEQDEILDNSLLQG